jgi:hypothetical protein
MTNLYVVTEGCATRLDAPVEFDGVESLQALAESAADALALAAEYDAGHIGYDNHVWRGLPVVAVKRTGE